LALICSTVGSSVLALPYYVERIGWVMYVVIQVGGAALIYLSYWMLSIPAKELKSQKYSELVKKVLGDVIFSRC